MMRARVMRPVDNIHDISEYVTTLSAEYRHFIHTMGNTHIMRKWAARSDRKQTIAGHYGAATSETFFNNMTLLQLTLKKCESTQLCG